MIGGPAAGSRCQADAAGLWLVKWKPRLCPPDYVGGFYGRAQNVPAPGRYGNRRSRKRSPMATAARECSTSSPAAIPGKTLTTPTTNRTPTTMRRRLSATVNNKGVRHQLLPGGRHPLGLRLLQKRHRHHGQLALLRLLRRHLGGCAAGGRSGSAGSICQLQNWTWRDVKLILADSARRIRPGRRRLGSRRRANISADSDDDRYWFNFEYGFGVADAGAAVALALDWTNLPYLAGEICRIRPPEPRTPR